MVLSRNQTQGGSFFMNNNKLVFHKLIAEIGGSFIDSTIQKYAGDYRCQHFDTKSHINSMIYLNIRGCKSLREADGEISANKKLRSKQHLKSQQAKHKP